MAEKVNRLTYLFALCEPYKMLVQEEVSQIANGNLIIFVVSHSSADWLAG